ncbi:hypothetical protein GW915_03100 [bacterium]|nr:hypothetical protein [bacterium]
MHNAKIPLAFSVDMSMVFFGVFDLRRLILILTLVALPSLALPKLFTLNTSHNNQKLMLDSFESENKEDIAQITPQLVERLEQIKKEFGNQEVILKLNIDETLRARFESEDHLLDFIEQLESTLPVSVQYDRVPKHSLRKAYKKVQSALLNNYRWSFTLIRTFAIGTAAAVSLKLSEGLPWEIAIGTGALAGFLSGNVQYWSQYIYKWMDSTSGAGKKVGGRLSKFLQRFGLNIGAKGQEGVENFAKWSERFGKWYAMEVVFVYLLCGGMIAIGAEDSCHLTDVLATSALATGSQGVWDFAVTTAQNLKLQRGEREKDVSYFGQLSFLSVATLTTGVLTILKLLDVPHADMAFYLTGATGLFTLVKTIIAKSKLSEEMKEAPSQKTCEVELLIPAF